MIRYNDVLYIIDEFLMNKIRKLYSLDTYLVERIAGHEGGRNITFRCRDKEMIKILRISYLQDRNFDDILSEVEYVRYLHDHGASVANVLTSQHNNLHEFQTIIDVLLRRCNSLNRTILHSTSQYIIIRRHFPPIMDSV